MGGDKSRRLNHIIGNARMQVWCIYKLSCGTLVCTRVCKRISIFAFLVLLLSGVTYVEAKPRRARCLKSKVVLIATKFINLH
jgi:hypothetical protein